MKKKLKINAAITTTVIIICVILVNLIISVISAKKPLQIDLTREKIYQFSEQTTSVMEKLTDEVMVYALYPDDVTGEGVKYVKEYLKKYEQLSDKFTVTYIDPYNEPNFVKQYETKGDYIDVGSIIVSCNNKFDVVNFSDLFTTNQYTNSTSIDMEKKLTSAVMNVTGSAKNINIYFTQGHDEYESNNFRQLLTNESFTCENINLLTTPVAENASILVIADPTMDFSPEEIKAIEQFSDNGGHILLTAHPGKELGLNLKAYIADWGVSLENDYIVENDSSHAFRSQYGGVYPAPLLQNHKITQSIIEQKLNFVAPMSRSITLKENNVFNAQHEVLMKTTEKSWAKINLSSATSEKEDGDHAGPLNVATISTKHSSDNTSSSLFVLGSLMSIEEYSIISQNSYANSNFIINTILYLTKSSDVLDIHAKNVTPRQLTITQTQARAVNIVLYLIPTVIFIGGIIMWIRRRYL